MPFSGLEIDFDRFRGRLLRLTVLGYVLSFGIALLVGFALVSLTLLCGRAERLTRQPAPTT